MNISVEPVLLLGALLSLLYTSHGTVLSKVTKIALDSSRLLEAKRMKALYASFSNTRPFWVQLWNRTYSDSAYRLDWQVRVQPRFGDGSIEVLNLSVAQYVTVVPAIHVLAIMNELIPGPLNGNYRDGAGVILSLRDRDYMGLPLNKSIMFQFDNLRLPYHLPVTLCNQSGCPYELGILPTPRPSYPPIKPAVSRQPSRLLTEEMLVGLITWNIVLTLLLFLVLLVLVFICADLEKRRKETARYGLEETMSSISTAGSGGYMPGSAFPGGGALPGVLDYSMSHPGMVEIRDSDSDVPISPEAFEKMPSARF